jgi:hypothetical protein
MKYEGWLALLHTSSFIIHTLLLVDFLDEELVLGMGGRVGEGIGRGEVAVDHILAQHVLLGDGVGGGGNALQIEFVDLLHVVEYGREMVLVQHLLLFGQRQPRQQSYFFNILDG